MLRKTKDNCSCTENARPAIKLATLGLDVPVVLDEEFLKCVCEKLKDSDSPEAELEYLVDGIKMTTQHKINVCLALYDLNVYSYSATGQRRKILAARRDDSGQLQVYYMELTRVEAEDIASKLVF